MSIRLMSDVWQMEMPPAEKLVMLALADAANDEGWCWPSIATIARKSGLSERSVQRSIRDFQGKGWVIRHEVIGKGCKYHINPRHSVTPDTVSPPTDSHHTPDTVSPKPSKNHKPSEAKASSGVPAKPADRYHRLPVDWAPAKPLPASIQAKVDMWPPGKLRDELAKLHRWAANASNDRGKGRKLNWDIAWENWLERADDDLRKHKPANDRNEIQNPMLRAGIARRARRDLGEGSQRSGSSSLWGEG